MVSTRRSWQTIGQSVNQPASQLITDQSINQLASQAISHEARGLSLPALFENELPKDRVAHRPN